MIGRKRIWQVLLLFIYKFREMSEFSFVLLGVISS